MFKACRPDTQDSYAYVRSAYLLKQPRVQEAIKSAEGALVVKSEVTKTSLIEKTSQIIDKAEIKEMYGAALKGIELQGRFIGAFESDEADEAKYVQFITKISGKNVTVVNSLEEDNRKVEINGSPA